MMLVRRIAPLAGAARRNQMYPRLSADEIVRSARFGTARVYRAGEALIRTGGTGHGLFVMTAGRVRITRQDATNQDALIVEHVTGSIVGETAIVVGV